jgi:hypothetical protein
MTPIPEFEILVTRFGNTAVFQRHPGGHLTFWTYARNIESAIADFKSWPVTIIVQGTSPTYEEEV